MSDYLAHLAENRRLATLRVLASAPAHTLNDSVLQTALERLGHVVSRDQIRTDLAWLAEQLLVELETVESVTVARLRQRGLDVAEGRAVAPGVKKPGPR